MELFSTGRRIGQAVKNVQRLRQIVGVFASNGFSDFINRMNLGRYLPTSIRERTLANSDRSISQSLRHSFEQLGPTFVKFGQVLSMRPDLIPEEMIEEFKKLQDDVQPLPFEVAKKTIETEFGRPIADVFGSFDPVPIAAASISQVHAATLLNGEPVVVKVQRPEIQKVIETDVSLLQFLARLLERSIPEARVFNPEVIVSEFFATLSLELDFLVEANNMEKIRRNMASVPEIVIPKTHRAYCTKRVMTMEKLNGVRMNDPRVVQFPLLDRKKIVEVGARAFFKSIVMDGLFHGDLHSGNLFVLPGNRLGIIDFGIVGRLSPRARDQFVNMVVALVSEDFENLCRQYAELGNASGGIDFDSFVREVRNTLAPYMGLTISEVNVGRVLIDATRIAARYKIRIPGDWMIVFKAILTVEGMARQLDPGFDLLSTGHEFAKGILKQQISFDRWKQDLFFTGREVIDLFQLLPRQVKYFVKKFASNDYAFEVKSPELREIRRQMEKNGKRLTEGVIATGFFIAGAMIYSSPNHHLLWGMPTLTVIFFALGFFLTFRNLFK